MKLDWASLSKLGGYREETTQREVETIVFGYYDCTIITVTVTSIVWLYAGYRFFGFMSDDTNCVPADVKEYNARIVSYRIVPNQNRTDKIELDLFGVYDIFLSWFIDGQYCK